MPTSLPNLFALLLAAAPAAAQDPLAPVDAAPQPAAVDPPPLTRIPELVHFVEAPYPAQAEADGVEGSVLLLLELDEQGVVRTVEIIRSAGNGFDEAAVAAARQMLFTPAEDALGPVPVTLEFEYGFTLRTPGPEAPQDTPPPVNLEGTVVERGTRTPLEGVAVYIMVDGQRQTTSTDAAGRWSFNGVPPGRITVNAAWPGYGEVSEEVDVVSDEVTDLRLWMTSRDYRGDEVVGLYYKNREPDITRHTVSMAEVRRVPGTFGDPVRIIQSLPGAARPIFGSSQLILRGANPEDSNVYVDGVEVPIIYHLGGIRSVINPALINSVDYLPGGYGVRYGRSIGGVVDVQTSEDYPERRTATWHTDFLDSSLFSTGRVGKDNQLGFAAGIRRSYLDWLIKPFLPDDAPTIKPRWFDYQLKLQTLKKGPNTFSLLLFGFHDLMLIENPDGFAVGSDEEGEEGLSASYQTHRAVGTWRRPLGPELELSLRPMLGWDDLGFDLSTDMELLLRSIQLGLRGELRWTPNETWQLTGGVDTQLSRYDMMAKLGEVSSATDDPLQEADAFSFDDGGWTSAPDPFVDLQLRPLADPDKLVIDLGLRLETLLVSGADPLVGVDPRFAMRWDPIPSGTLKLGTGLYQQHPEQRTLALDSATSLPLERAWSSELGWEQHFGVQGSLDITAFYKDIDRLGVFNPELQDILTDDLFVADGLGRVYGMELLLRKEPIGNLFGWVSYTLSRSLRTGNDSLSFSASTSQGADISADGDDDGDVWYPYDYDQTHILTLVAGYGFPWDFDLSTRVQYVTGNPYTPYDDAVYQLDDGYYAPVESVAINSTRMDPYFSVDLRLSKLKAFKRWTLEGFIDLLNVVHGENPEMIIFNYDYTESTYVQGLPTIPSLGFEAEFTF